MREIPLLLFIIFSTFSNGWEWFQEWIDLLREMVIKLPQLENLNLFRALCSEDADQDFFNNIVHLQVMFLFYMLLCSFMFVLYSPIGSYNPLVPFCISSAFSNVNRANLLKL